MGLICHEGRIESPRATEIISSGRQVDPVPLPIALLSSGGSTTSQEHTSTE
ncbi:hypothetical protein NBRC3293_3045 [Gluconobacter oxydans NBRC 3293]|uniref:Uncharacterized protein n=1 Tax=Gluconobacter oxydans NBRC 3293 TaxID=1315969 RepID=A0A829X6S1_GLUOY|nr:hypothetical protein NBRC3293_3007 [Gluconobacter oxydans NBRC 3293]GEM18548.1 hypothetical protein NBRC3293_3045 [Gluconobacter oxydans NBRC 3293]